MVLFSMPVDTEEELSHPARGDTRRGACGISEESVLTEGDRAELQAAGSRGGVPSSCLESSGRTLSLPRPLAF